MAEQFICATCENDEAHCRCDVRDYCSLCLGADNVRLCEDGQYYCRTCREACDYQAQ